MKKIAVVISSFSGKLNEEVIREGMFSLPLQIQIEQEQWLEGFYTEATKHQIVDHFINATDYNTSLPPLALILEQMEELATTYEQVLYLPLDSQLSATCDTLKNYAKKYPNVTVFNNHLNGSALFHVGRKCKQLYEEANEPMSAIVRYLEKFNDNTIGYIIPRELKTFIKSGRLKGIKKTLLTSINLSLMIEVGHLLKKAGIARTKKSAVNKVIARILDFMRDKQLQITDVDFTLNYAYNEEIAALITGALAQEGIQLTYREESSIATLMHTGYGAAYIGINPKIK